MTSPLLQLPPTRLSAERVPAEARRWVEDAILAPLNRLLPALTATLRRLPLSHVNVQVLEYRGLPPSTSAPAEWVSTLSGQCVGVVPCFARTLETGGSLGASVGALTMPTWVEVALTDRAGSRLRITSQTTLTPTTRYVLRWIAFGM